MRLFVILLFSAICLFGQTETKRWGKTDIYAGLKPVEHHDHSVRKPGVLSIFYFLYQRGFSDHDGDNCPFHPTCSAFFVQSVKNTNIFQGMVMFSDRFTRDMNFYKSASMYSMHYSGKLYDPVHNYLSLKTKIKVEVSE